MSNHVFLFDRNDETRYNNIQDKSTTIEEHESYLLSQLKKLPLRKNDIIGPRTLYLGNSYFEYTVYARLSKRDNKPVVHREFRISGDNIRKHLGVVKKGASYLSTLQNLAGLRSSIIFEKLHNKYISYYDINKLSVAKHFANASAKKKLSAGEVQGLGLSYQVFKGVYRIETAAELQQWCREKNLDYRIFLQRTALITPCPSSCTVRHHSL
jgi:hypothetical protein